MLAVCPNPTIDRLVLLGELIPGTVDRAKENQAYPAGKSVSSARGCRANLIEPRVLVLLPGQGSDWYLDTLRAEGMAVDAHFCAGQVRESIIVIEDSGRVSVLNGPGAVVSEADWAGFVDAVLASVVPGEWVICSGSFPPGVGDAEVGGFVASVVGAGARLALDTGPTWMDAALAGAKPALITPNLAEAEGILRGEAGIEDTAVGADALERAEVAAEQLRLTGIESVVVTAGSAGLAWATAAGHGALPGLSVEVRNPIGAGDAFLGGLVSRLEQGLPFAEAAAWGMATSVAAIEGWSPGGADPARVEFHHARITG